MTLRVPAGRTDSGGDGSATDAAGRRFVTSHLGVQVFDAAGQWLGLIEKPGTKACVSVAVAGSRGEFLYLCASDKVYRRRLAR
jgi:sugar lactone lactonase YvrE